MLAITLDARRSILKLRTGQDGQQLAAARILVVDDDPGVLRVIRSHLSTAGVGTIWTCDDSTRAICVAAEEQPDVTLLDLVMPGRHGLEVLGELRDDRQLRSMHVLVLTASSEPSDRLAAYEAGADDFISKPVEPEELLARVSNALARKAQLDHLRNYADNLQRKVIDIYATNEELRKRADELQQANDTLRQLREAGTVEAIPSGRS